MTYFKLAILKTLHYADMFSYPLSQHQLWSYLISAYPVSKKLVEQTLSSLIEDGLVIKHQSKNLYSLKNKKNLFKLRDYRNKLSRKKKLKAQQIASILSHIPTINLIGLSGGLSINNAKKGDDIDFFIITSTGYVWLTRLLVIIILELMRIRRRPREKKINNKICLNMIVDENHLAIPFSERDIFSAHEVAQMKPIFTRGNTYYRFIYKNRWVREFLANITWKIKKCQKKINTAKENLSFYSYLSIIIYWITRPFELLAKYIQLAYMSRHKTSEIVKDGYLRFHPKDQRFWILSKFYWRLTRLENLQQKNQSISLTPLPIL